jgi:hypothetical protein
MILLCRVIPDFDTDGILPPGIHPAEPHEFVERFANNSHRLRLFRGLQAGLNVLRSVGCNRVYVDGSYVTSKELPNDYDAAWDAAGVNIDQLLALEPLFGIFSYGRAGQKAKYLGEYFPANFRADGAGRTFLDFFQTDKSSGARKGIVSLDLTAAAI